MDDYRHILFATDLSPNSEKIGQTAVKIAQKSGAKLSLIYVLPPNPLFYGGGEAGIPIELMEAEGDERKHVENRLRTQGKHLGVSKEDCWLLVGSSKKSEILELVMRLKPDLLVCGSHDKHGLAVLRTSTADALFHAMPCDVLAVHVK